MCEVWSVKIYLHENALIGIIYSIVIQKPKLRVPIWACVRNHTINIKSNTYFSQLCISVLMLEPFE